jgi:decaprenylphospho-beta-D-erythro-pentofuranosid-2-ulose 2-reductase
VFGGTSEIALAIVRELQSRSPREVVLAGRDHDGLERAAERLRAAGCPRVATVQVDALETEAHAEAIGRAFGELGGADIVVLAVGILGERGGMPQDIAGAVQVLQTNTVGAGSLLLRAAERLRADGGGTMLVLSSVAAGRPRRANAVYGASKAGLDSLAQAIGDELREQGVRVVVVRPGFVHTRMTRGLDAAPLSSTPEEVARVTIDTLSGDAHTVWAPRSLRWVMLAIGMLPRSVFRRIRQ